jgi:4-diphosphocytidyl-2-C-methyl-D-erythritol kinase
LDKISVKCPAKINLSLDVVGKRPDGYHLVRMIMQSIGLFDNIRVSKNNGGINLTCSKPLPLNEGNIAYRAAKLMLESFSLDGGVDIFIEKNIPIAAGLAGGSTDAAGVIKAMNEIYKLGLTTKEMMETGLKLGADVPFCIMGGTALAEGIGEVLTPLPSVDAWCLIAKPPVGVSTKEVYGRLKLDEISRHPDTSRVIEYINKKNIEGISESMVNVLEGVTIKKHPIIFEIKNIMMDFHALGSLMSGSGPTVFGIFKDKSLAETCYHRLKDYLKEVYLVKTYNGEM